MTRQDEGAVDLAGLGAYVAGQEFDSRVVASQPLVGVEFEDCTFTGVVLDAIAMRRCVFRDCRFEQCSLSGMTWPDTVLTGCVFEGCRIVGTSFSTLGVSALADPCELRGTRLHLCSLAERDLTRWTFTDCAVAECDLTGCDLRRTVWENCDFDGTALRGCDLRDAAFPGATRLAFDIRDNQVRGLRLDPDLAPVLLHSFGIRFA